MSEEVTDKPAEVEAAAPVEAPAAAPAAAPAPSLMARGKDVEVKPEPEAKPEAKPDPSVPEKYLVKAADGSIDWQATALKQHADGYQPLLQKMHGGEAPPKTPDDYIPEAQGVDIAKLKEDPLYKGFVKGAHSLGINNKQLSYILEGYAQRLALQAPTPETAEAELRKTWASDDALQAAVGRSYRAVSAFAGDEETKARLDQKFGNDPDFIRLMARIGSELGEDKPVGGLNAAESETLDSLIKSPAYFDTKHPDHARVVERAKALYAKKFPG